ncbi:MAG: hypothetical protein ABJK59_04770 [Erythrobacter sp.]|uniref:relaxase/mobilization nuclease domain-containing protein n=1 Tax=Erythrobacter sp. TaxID=1042 RepID=UPI003299F478
MILVGNSRGGARNLADHLMKDENDHVSVHELRGFAADDLHGAMNETYAISRGTKCEKFFFSLSLNPPPNERVETPVFDDAIARVEDRLGLTGQPRAIVLHEKDGRRHAHAVWSRIDAETMPLGGWITAESGCKRSLASSIVSMVGKCSKALLIEARAIRATSHWSNGNKP